MTSPSTQLYAWMQTHARWMLFGTLLLNILLHLNILPLELRGVHLWRQTETMSMVLNLADGNADLLHPKVSNEFFYPEGIKRMEFPIMTWIYAGFYKVLGDRIWVARTLSLIISLLTIWGAFTLGKTLYRNAVAGALAAWCAAWSPVFYYYAVNPIPDNLALMAAVWFLAFWHRWQAQQRTASLMLSAAFLSLSVATKLPFAVFGIIPFIAGIQVLLEKGKAIGPKTRKLLTLWLPFATFILIPAIWYLTVIPEWKGTQVVSGVLASSSAQIGELAGYLWGILISILPELLLNYGAVLFFLIGLIGIFIRKLWKQPRWIPWFGVALSLLAYVIFELNMITTVHDYYLFPFLPPLFLIAAWGAYWMISQARKGVVVFALILLIALPALAFLRIDSRWTKASSLGYHPDYGRYQKELIEAVPKDAKCLVASDQSPYIVLYMVRKQGAVIEPEGMRSRVWELCKTERYPYLYSDSRTVEKDSRIQSVLGELVLQKGEIRIYALNWN